MLQTQQGPFTPLLDDFNRPDEDPVSQGASWSPCDPRGCPYVDLLSVVSNQAANIRTGEGAGAISYRAQDFPTDFEAYATVAVKPQGGHALEIVFNISDIGPFSADFYYLSWVAQTSGDLLRIWRFTDCCGGGAQSALLAEVPVPMTAGDKLMVRRIGSAIEGWTDDGGIWTRQIDIQDSTFIGGKVGLGMSGGAAARFDDFGGGAFAASSSPPPEQCNGSLGGSGDLGLCTGHALADPVNTLTGAFVTQVQDLQTPGTGVSFDWTRSYTSSDATSSPLGPGWTFTYAASLTIAGNGDVTARGADGQVLQYMEQGNGSFRGAPGARAVLSSIVGGYQLVLQDQTVYTFDAQGKLTSIKDRNGQGVALTYEGQGRLANVTDAAGRQASVGYNAQNLVSSITTQDGRSIAYGYTSGLLTSVTDVRGKSWTYTYDAGGRLATIVDPLRHTQVQNVYGGDGRVQSQRDALQKQTTFASDAATGLATVTDPNNHVWKDDYDAGLLAKETDPLNETTQFGHDANLNANAVTSPEEETTVLSYDSAGNLQQATAPATLGSAQKTFVYNARNDPTQVTDARGTVTSYTYTAAGNVQTVTQDEQQVASYTYFQNGQVQSFTDGRGKQSSYTYDASGNLATVTDPLGNKTTYTYWPDGNVKTSVDPKGNCQGCVPSDYTTSYSYNAAGQLLTETDPLGHVTQTNVYDDAGRLQSTTDAKGHTTSYTYDDANRLLTETAPDPDGNGPLTAPVTTYTYDDAGNKLTETDPRGNKTTYAYNAANELASQTGPDPDGGGPLSAPVTTYAYDLNGNLASLVEPRGNVQGANPDDYRTTHSYDAAGRLLTETKPDPDGAGPQTAPVTTNTYDPVGNLQSVRDANNHLTSYSYDGAGRILTVTAPDLGVTTYTYDPAGNLSTRKDDNQHTTSYAYDDAGELASETGPDPDSGGAQTGPVTSYTYDRNGNEHTKTEPNGNATQTAGDGVTTYGYDRANRLTAIDYSDTTPDVSFTYDNLGNRLTMADGSGTDTRTYDNLDRLTGVTRGANSFSYQYDAAGNVTQRTYPGAFTTNYTYDPLNRLATVSEPGGTTTYTYDPASNLTLTATPANKETRIYDRADRLTEVKNERLAGTLRSRFVMTLDPVGNPTRIDRTGALGETQTYSYDASDRLTSVCFATSCSPGAPALISWSYDKVGNRLTETRSSVTTTYGYDARDRLLSAGATNYTYDQNGNERSAGATTFTYDLENRLKTAVQGATTTTYSYDGESKRLKASTGTGSNANTNFLWEVNQPLPQLALERNGANNLLRQYVYGIRRIRQTQGAAASYYLYDGLGSVVTTTAPAGALQQSYSYEPFGAIHTQTGTGPTNFFYFTGEYLDPTGLYHLRARQYDPGSGRFLGPDATSDAVGAAASSYSYAADRPTVMVDPSGMSFQPAGDGRDAADCSTSTSTRCPALSFSDSARARWALPFPLSTHFGGVDQGVDYKPTGSVKAIAPGMIYHHSKPGSWRSIGGNGEAVYERLDYPARIHGRTYRNVYYAEQKSIVKHGSVNAGQPVMIGGWDELGFAKTCTCDPAPFAPFPGRDAQGHTPATQAGRDFYDFLRWIQRYLRARR